MRYARQRLDRMEVDLRTGIQVDADGVTAAGKRINAANVFWCAEMAATPATAWIGIKPGKRGGLEVGANCSVPGHPEIFAIGDVASLKGADGRPLPGVALVAEQQGCHVAGVIAPRVAGGVMPGPFRQKD